MEQTKTAKLEMVRKINLDPALDKSKNNPVRTLLEALKRSMVLNDFHVDRPNWSLRGTRVSENHYPSGMTLCFNAAFGDTEELTEPEDSRLKDILDVYQQLKTQIMLLGARVQQKDGDNEKEISPLDYVPLEIDFEVSWFLGEQLADKVKGIALIQGVELESYSDNIQVAVHWLVNLQPVIDLVNLGVGDVAPSAALNE